MLHHEIRIDRGGRYRRGGMAISPWRRHLHIQLIVCKVEPFMGNIHSDGLRAFLGDIERCGIKIQQLKKFQNCDIFKENAKRHVSKSTSRLN